MSSIQDEVRRKYAAAASRVSGQTAGVRAVAEAFGYTPEQLAAVPADANLGLSCGNPTAFASLRPGEVVVDLGCGAGLDVLLSAERIGPSGRAVGIDMTPGMLDRARKNSAGRANIEFHQAAIDRLPLPDASVDCVVSNCVINLAPDKEAGFREMYRALKPRRRVALSDIALKRPLPDELARDVAAYVGCIAGAIAVSDYEAGLRRAGFAAVEVVDTQKDLNAYALVEGQSGCCSPNTSCCGPAETAGVHGSLADLIHRYNLNDYAASVQVYAVKAAG